MLAGTFFTAISQVLLKQSANKKYSNPLLEYLNWRVIVAYGIFFGVLLLNTWCYTKVDMRFGPVIDTAAYVFVLIFSRVILNEKITKGKLVGNLLIIACRKPSPRFSRPRRRKSCCPKWKATNERDGGKAGGHPEQPPDDAADHVPGSGYESAAGTSG